jgi:putative ABC transport system permease protein
MSAIGSIAWAGIKGRRKASSLAMVAVTALAATAIVAGLAVQDQTGPNIDRKYEAAGRPDLVVYGSDDALRAVSRMPEVDATSGILETVNADVVNADGSVSARLVAVDGNAPPAAGRPLLQNGRWAHGSTEVVLDHGMAVADGVKLGEQVAIRTSAGTTALTVVGTAIDLTDCFYPDCDPVRLFMDRDGLAALHAAGSDRGTMLIARLHDPAAAERVATQVLAQRGIDGTNTWPDTRGDITIRPSIFAVFLDGFGIFVLVAAALVIASAMGARLAARRREIALFKSVGFTVRQVTLAMIGENVVLAAVGVLVGWCVGSLLAPHLQVGLGDVIGRSSVAFSPVILAVTMAGIALVIVAATIVPAWRASRRATTEMLRDLPPEALHPGVVGRVLERLGAGPTATYGVGDVMARPGRAALSAGALAIGVAGIVVAGGFIRSMEAAGHDPSRTGDPWDVMVERGEVAPSTVEASLSGTPGVRSWFNQIDRTSTLDGESFLARAVGGDPDSAGFVIRDGRAMRGGDDAVAGYGFLERFGLKVGDRVAIGFGPTPITVNIVGRYSETEDTGEVLMFRKEALDKVTPGIAPETYLVSGVPPVDRAALALSLRSALPTVANVQALDTGAGLSTFMNALRLTALIVLAVVLANLVASLVTDARERARTLGVLRTVGFRTSQLVGQAAMGGAVLGLVAAIVGLPVGLWAFNTLSTVVTNSIGAGPGFSEMPSTGLLVLVVPATVIAGALAGIGATTSLATKPAAALVRYE